MNPDEELLGELDKLAQSISADPSFTAALEARLQQGHRASLAQSAPRWWQRLMQPRLVYRLAFALLLCLIVAVPVLAGGWLRYFVLVAGPGWPLPSGDFTSNPISNATIQPLASHNVRDLEKIVGFSILSPTYLPPDCQLAQYAHTTPTSAAILSYACVDILEQKAIPDWRQNPLRQPVGPNSVQELTIGGQPAYYIEGTWLFDTRQRGAPATPAWVPGGARRLVFERGDLLIDIAAIPDAITNGVVSGLISKEVLIKIAQGMK